MFILILILFIAIGTDFLGRLRTRSLRCVEWMLDNGWANSLTPQIVTYWLKSSPAFVSLLHSRRPYRFSISAITWPQIDPNGDWKRFRSEMEAKEAWWRAQEKLPQ